MHLVWKRPSTAPGWGGLRCHWDATAARHWIVCSWLVGKEAPDVIGAEAAKGGSRSGWALCQLKGSSYPPTKQETDKSSIRQLATSKLCEIIKPWEFLYIQVRVSQSVPTSRCSRGKISCSNRWSRIHSGTRGAHTSTQSTIGPTIQGCQLDTQDRITGIHTSHNSLDQ